MITSMIIMIRWMIIMNRWMAILRTIFLLEMVMTMFTLRWLMTMMVTIKDKTMREERTPMVIIVLVFIVPFSSQ